MRLERKPLLKLQVKSSTAMGLDADQTQWLAIAFCDANARYLVQKTGTAICCPLL